MMILYRNYTLINHKIYTYLPALGFEKKTTTCVLAVDLRGSSSREKNCLNMYQNYMWREVNVLIIIYNFIYFLLDLLIGS